MELRVWQFHLAEAPRVWNGRHERSDGKANSPPRDLAVHEGLWLVGSIRLSPLLLASIVLLACHSSLIPPPTFYLTIVASRVIQKAFDELSREEVANLVSTFKGNVIFCLNDHNGAK